MDFLSISKQNISLRCIQNPWLELYPFNSEDSKRLMNKSDQGSRDGLRAPPSGIRLRSRPVVLVPRPLNQIETLFETVFLLPLSYFLNTIAPMIFIIWTIFHMLTYIKQVFVLVHFWTFDMHSLHSSFQLFPAVILIKSNLPIFECARGFEILKEIMKKI